MEDPTVQGIMKEVSNFAEKFKNDDEENYQSPYAHLEKSTVLQEARVFHDPNAVRENPRKCCTVIAQLLHLQNLGQTLNSTEATEVFFGVTKLFMSDDASLRRMVYLFIKEVAETCDPDDVIIVTSCLTKDMTCDVDLYRANALRVLTRIVDSAMLGAIERYVKQAIVDASAQVSSSALISSAQLYDKNPECTILVKRWLGEMSEAISSPNEMVQFHALMLLYKVKSHDRLGVSKLVSQYSQRHSMRSPLALVLLVRYTSNLIHEEVREGRSGGSPREGSPVCRAGYAFLESSLRHKSELVVYEAAKAVCGLPGAEPQDLSAAIGVLQLFLSSPKPVIRFASMKTLAAVANVHPRSISKCNEDLETLLTDSNRNIATLAITTLLKTGSENNVDRLLKQISAFLTDIADEFKITVVGSLTQLCLTYPAKHRVLVGFLSNFLREEGGFDFKRSIITSIISLIHAVPESTEGSLLHLCEFIEDCEFAMLSTQILHLLGDLGPTTSAPARYIRFIYNRVILEHASVRAAAVSALAKFAAKVPSLRSSILSLLERSLMDEDDETRDRASMAISVLKRAMAEHPYQPPPEDAEAEDIPPDEPAPDDTAAFLILDDMPISFDALERSLKAYVAAPDALDSDEPLTFAALPAVEEPVAPPAPAAGAPAASPSKTAESPKEAPDPASAVYSVPELAALGRVFRSSAPVALTESETEYVVSCVKHVMDAHVVLQFAVQNTIDSQLLRNLSVAVESDEAVFSVVGEIAAPEVKYGETKNCYTLLSYDPNAPLAAQSFSAELKFTVVDVDPNTGEEENDGFEEEYPLEDLEVAASDFMAKVAVPDFRRGWESLGNSCEVLEKFQLPFKSSGDAVRAVLDFLGMAACDNTAAPKPGNKPQMLHLSGTFVKGRQVLARAQVSVDNGGVVLKIAVRSEDKEVSRMVADCIR